MGDVNPLEFGLKAIVEADDVNHWDRELDADAPRYLATEDMADFARMVVTMLYSPEWIVVRSKPNRAPIPTLTPDEKIDAEAQLINWLERCVDEGSMSPEQAANTWFTANL